MGGWIWRRSCVFFDAFERYTPLKIKMESQEARFLEDDFPFQTGVFQVPAVNFYKVKR